MRKFYLPKTICTLLLSILFAALCSGQSRATQNKPGRNNFGSVTPRAKMRKTQGSNEYQNVHCGLQDQAGNLWFGTTGEGVYRYDGKIFRQFTVSDGLSSNTVWSVLEDKKGNIWFGTDKGACRYNGTLISHVPFINANPISLYTGSTFNNSTSKKNAVWSIMQDKSGTIWFGADDGLYCYNENTFTRLVDIPGIINNRSLTLKSIQCMLEDSKGHFWFGSGPMAFEGICRYDGKIVTQFKPKNENWIRNITEAKNGIIFFATRHSGVCSYDGKDFTYRTAPQGMVKGSMTSSLEDKSGNTWFSSDYGAELNDSVGGVWCYNGSSYTKYSVKEGLTNNAVFLILEDRNGTIWVGTRNIGLYRFNGKTFDSFSE